MALEKGTCPWCGVEIIKPKLFRGICEHCHKPYMPVVLFFNRYYTHRSELPLVYYYLIRRGIPLFMSLLSFIFSFRTPAFWFPSVMMFALYIHSFLFKPKIFFKKENLYRAALVDDSRRIFVSDFDSSGLFHTSFEISLIHEEGKPCSEHCQAKLHTNGWLNYVVLEPDNNTLKALLKPGIEFKLYDNGLKCWYYGFTMNKVNEKAKLFQAQFLLNTDIHELDKRRFYLAHMELQEKDMTFFLVLDAYDQGQTTMTGKKVYEIILVHSSYPVETLPIPTSFKLYERDNTFIGQGRVVCFFANRNLFETEQPKNKELLSRNRWL